METSTSSSEKMTAHLKLFFLLSFLGLIGIFTSIKIPYSEVLVDARWTFGYMGFALLPLWLAIPLMCLLSLPLGTNFPFLYGFLGNLAYAIPFLIVIRFVHHRCLIKLKKDWLYGFCWFFLILLGYQIFTTPVVWSVLAWVNGKHVWQAIIDGWKTQPLLFESFFVALISATILVAVKTHNRLLLKQERLAHLNRVLDAVRCVNRLIVHQKERGRLIEEACHHLTQTMGYYSACVIIRNADGQLHSKTMSSIDEADCLSSLAQCQNVDELPFCAKEALSSLKTVVLSASTSNCHDCSSKSPQSVRAVLARKLAFEDELYGALIVSAPNKFILDDEEQALFREMCQDISFALHKIELARAHRRLEKEQNMLEKELQRAQRMESIGRLAGGVAHDFNNMLTVILGNSELLLAELDEKSQRHQDLKEIHEAARRSADLTSQLLAFARKQSVEPKLISLNETIEKMLNILKRLIGEDIELRWKPGENLPSILFDPSQIDQLLTNLVVNARDAIEDAGMISIETTVKTIDELYCKNNCIFRAGLFAMLAVSDNGIGMNPETQQHVFEPFYSTKELGKGTGLGLATVYGIMKQNNGFVNLYSEEGVGTTFQLFFPTPQASACENDQEPSEDLPKAEAREKILLVEDERAILAVGKRMLGRLGYAVILAATPQEAIHFIEQGELVDLLVTDVIMPSMNGKELSDKLRTIRPELKTLYISGYTNDVITNQGVLEAKVHFLSKPFSLQELALKVRQAIDSS